MPGMSPLTLSPYPPGSDQYALTSETFHIALPERWEQCERNAEMEDLTPPGADRYALTAGCEHKMKQEMKEV